MEAARCNRRPWQTVMPLVTFHDAAGKPIQLMEVDGCYYPNIPHADQDKSVREAKDAIGRDDDVIFIAYPKSGTHWIWEVLCMLHRGKAETIPKLKQNNMIEGLKPEQMKALESPRILNTHFPFYKLPRDMVRHKAKIVLMVRKPKPSSSLLSGKLGKPRFPLKWTGIFLSPLCIYSAYVIQRLLTRNPKDVAVSHYHHNKGLWELYKYDGDWKDYLPLFLDGKVDCNSWFDYVRGWERAMDENPDYPIHLMYYEDMKEDSAREIEKLVKFLSLNVSKEFCKEVAEKCEFHNMQKDKKGLEDEFWRTAWRNNDPKYYRKGEVGDWKNLFTEAQNETFDRIYKERMKDSKLNIRFEI